MKKLLFSGLCLALVLCMSSCGGKKAADINVNELKTACDHLNAMEICYDEITNLMGDKTDMSQFSEEELKQIELVSNKLEEVAEHADELEIPEEDAKKCDSYDRILKKAEKVDL